MVVTVVHRRSEGRQARPLGRNSPLWKSLPSNGTRFRWKPRSAAIQGRAANNSAQRTQATIAATL
jgi:hypothetical protein